MNNHWFHKEIGTYYDLYAKLTSTRLLAWQNTLKHFTLFSLTESFCSNLPGNVGNIKLLHRVIVLR